MLEFIGSNIRGIRLQHFCLIVSVFVGFLLAYISGVNYRLPLRFISQRFAFDSLEGNKCEHPWPQMEEIANLDFVKINKTNGNRTETIREFKYTAIPNAPMYWADKVSLDQVKDAPVCGFDGKCLEEDSNKGRASICYKPVKLIENATSFEVLCEDF